MQQALAMMNSLALGEMLGGRLEFRDLQGIRER
jgi:hypothetical protein